MFQNFPTANVLHLSETFTAALLFSSTTLCALSLPEGHQCCLISKPKISLRLLSRVCVLFLHCFLPLAHCALSHCLKAITGIWFRSLKISLRLLSRVCVLFDSSASFFFLFFGFPPIHELASAFSLCFPLHLFHSFFSDWFWFFCVKCCSGH